jgi:hypothetical protein
LNQAMVERAASAAVPIEQLQRAGTAYVAFALRRPQHFTVMFDTPVGGSSKAAEAGRQAFETLLGAIEKCQQARQLPAGETLERALVAWSLVHGVARPGGGAAIAVRFGAGAFEVPELAVERSRAALAWAVE